jgi:subtilisin family serine protease
MALRLPAFLSLAVAVFAARPVPSVAAPPDRATPTAIVFKLRASAPASAAADVVAEQLAIPRRRDAPREIAGLRPLFVRPAPRREVALPSPSPELDRVYLVDVPAGVSVQEAVARVADDARVEYAQPDYVREPHLFNVSDPYYQSSGTWGQPYADLWGLKQINAEHAWNFSRGQSVVVAVVDSGIDFTHPDLVSQAWVNPDEIGQAPDNGYPGDLHGWDFVSNDNDPRDELGHGTHVAGIIAAQANDGGIVGVAPEVKLMAVRAIRSAGTGNSSTIAAGIVYAADNGAHVITVSSGCAARCPSDPLVESAVRHAGTRGAIVVVSAGNRRDDLAFYSPQNMIDSRPIVVGSSDPEDEPTRFQNSGNFLDLVAPGGGDKATPGVVRPVSNILSAAASSCSPLFCTPALRVGDKYVRRAGTSMSAAYVSGVVALLVGVNPAADVDSVRAALFGNADDLGRGGYDAHTGWGRLTGLNTVADLRRYVLARILSPKEGQFVSGVVRIVGAADARSFSGYEISVGHGANPRKWQTTGLTPVDRPTPQGDLAEWNTRGLPNGLWTIQLVVTDAVAGERSYLRRVLVHNVSAAPRLVLDVASEDAGTGTVQVDPVGAVCAGFARSTERCSYPGGPATVLTLTAAPGELSVFTGWSGACAGTGPCTATVTALQGVRATFRGPARLGIVGGGAPFVSVDPPGTGCSGRCAFVYTPGTSVTVDGSNVGPLQTISITGETCGGASSCALLMDRDRLVHAEVFEPASDAVLISATADPPRVPLGTTVTLTGSITNQFEPGAVYNSSWQDLLTGENIGDTASITVTPGFGYHEYRFTAFREMPDGTTESFFADVSLVVHDA